MNRSAAFQIAAVATLAIIFTSQSPAEGPYSGPVPKDRRELYGVMLEMMGNPNVDVAEHHAVAELFVEIQIRKDLIEALMEHLDDERVLNPAMEVQSGNGAKAKYTVGESCDSLLREKFHISPYSKYRVGDWKVWWKKQTEVGKSFEDIWADVKAAEHD